MSVDRSDDPTFFYSDDCPLCSGVLATLLPIFDERKITLVVRKPTPQELKVEGFAFPCLFIPRGVFGVKQPTMLVGEYLRKGLDDLLD